MLTFAKSSLLMPWLTLDADKGGAGGSADDTGGKDKDAQDKAQDKDKGKGQGGDSGNDEPKDERKFTQADLDAIVKDRLERERKAREKEALKAKEEAEAKALVDQQEWQKLAQKHEAKVAELTTQVAELEPFKEKAERYESVLKKYLESERAGLPAHILALLDKLDVADQLEYIAKNRADLKPDKKKVPETPDAADLKELSDSDRAAARKGADAFYRSTF